MSNNPAANIAAEKPAGSGDAVLDFSTFPPEALHAYIAHYDLARSYPPSTSNGSGGSGSRSSPEEAQRPRVASDDDETNLGRRTATRLRQRSPHQQHQRQLNEDHPDEEALPCPEHFADADAASNYLGAVAGRHFAQLPPPKEGEVVVGFLYRCRAGDKTLKVAQ